MLGELRCNGGAQAVLAAKKSKILKSLKSARNGWKCVGEGPGVLESAICARATSIFQRSERGGPGGGAPPAAAVQGSAAVQGGCTRGSGGEKIENFEKS